jgi:hypothetical protein
MNSDLYTLGALALVLLLGWFIDHLDPWRESQLYRETLRRVKKSAAAVGGATTR